MEDKLKHLKESMEQTIFKSVPFDREKSIRAVKTANNIEKKRHFPFKKGILSGLSLVVCLGLVLFTINWIMSPANQPQPPSQTPHPMTVNGILEQTAKAQDQLNSFHSALTFNITLTSGDQSAMLTNKGSIDIEGSQQPIGHVLITSQFDGNTTSSEMYITDQTSYMKSSDNPKWIKKDTSISASEDQINSYDPFNDLPLFKKNKAQVKLNTNKDTYVLKTDIKQGQFKQIVQDYLGGSLPDDMTKAFKNITFEDLQCTYTFDKKTFYPKNTKLTIQARTDDENGGTVGLTILFNMDFSKINNVSPISIPKDVLEQAASK